MRGKKEKEETKCSPILVGADSDTDKSTLKRFPLPSHTIGPSLRLTYTVAR